MGELILHSVAPKSQGGQVQLKAQTFADSNSARIKLLLIYYLMETKIALKPKEHEKKALIPFYSIYNCS